MHIDLPLAEHEAAHLVVGLSLGLRLRTVSLEPTVLDGLTVLGYTWFGGSSREGLARSIMYCAGVAWESRPGGVPVAASADRRLARKYFRSEHDLQTGVKIAAEILATRRRVHASVVSELLDRARLGPKDVERLVLG
jgi:hypothetical protein